MSFILPVILFFIFMACVGFLYTEGMWGNFIMLVNVVTAGLLALNFYEPLARMFEGMASSFTFFWDFLSLWLIFALSITVFRLITDRISRTKVRFLGLADRIGSGVLAAWVGWVMVCFTLTTLHTAPLQKYFMGGGFRPEDRMLLGTAPDRQWLGFMQAVSRGVYSRSLPPGDGSYGPEPNPEEQKLAVFDRQADFIPKYAARRAALEGYVNSKDKGTFRIAPEDMGSRIPTR